MISFPNYRLLSRTRFLNGIIWISIYTVICLTTLPTADSSAWTHRRRKSTPGENVQTFECTDANTYLYQVLSQSKTARSLNTELSSSDGSSSNSHHPDIPRKAINGDHLKVCAQGFTCCTEEMESRLLSESKKEFQKSVQDKIVGLSHTFESRTSKFDRFFRELLSNARRDLHTMFLRTYGLLYEQNSDIFAALFDNLTQYYGNGPSTPSTTIGVSNLQTSTSRVNLSRAIDWFYGTLYQRMFRILNQPYDFEPRYWQCMSGQMERLKPFGNVPANMKQQVKKAFIAARTFVLALATGRDVVRKMMEVSPSPECVSGLTRMLYCHHCRGLSNVKPCPNFCLNVMRGCLGYHTDFDHNWNEYLDALLQLLTRLEGPFNIETVIDPIDVKISEAIMIFQDRGKEISDQIFAECGSPKNAASPPRQRRGRSRRESLDEVSTGAPPSRKRQRGRGRHRQQNQQQQQRPIDGSLNIGDSAVPFQPQPASARPTTAAGTSLDRLARDLREKVLPAKGFWRHLPYALCGGDTTNPTSTNVDPSPSTGVGTSNTNCWNGMDKDSKYEESRDGQPAESGRSSGTIISDLLIKLQSTTAALKKALQGQEPNWRSFGEASDGQKSNATLKKDKPKETVPAKHQGRPDLADSPGSGDIIDDTENGEKSKFNADNTDDEDLTGGSGSGDGEIELPLPGRPSVFGGVLPGHTSTKSPFFHQPEEDDLVEVGGGEDKGRLKETTAGWASSEEGNGNTFEPVTSQPDTEDDESDDEEEYDEDLDDEKGWKEDDYGLSSTTTSTSGTVQRMRPETTTTSSIFVQDTSTFAPLFTNPSTRADPPVPSTPPPTRKVVTVKKKPPPPAGGGASPTLYYSSSILYFLLAFYSALTLLWKRLSL